MTTMTTTRLLPEQDDSERLLRSLSSGRGLKTFWWDGVSSCCCKNALCSRPNTKMVSTACTSLIVPRCDLGSLWSSYFPKYNAFVPFQAWWDELQCFQKSVHCVQHVHKWANFNIVVFQPKLHSVFLMPVYSPKLLLGPGQNRWHSSLKKKNNNKTSCICRFCQPDPVLLSERVPVQTAVSWREEKHGHNSWYVDGETHF